MAAPQPIRERSLLCRSGLGVTLLAGSQAGEVLQVAKLHRIPYFKTLKAQPGLPPSKQGSFAFDLPINDVQGVQIAQGTCYFSSVEASSWF